MALEIGVCVCVSVCYACLHFVCTGIKDKSQLRDLGLCIDCGACLLADLTGQRTCLPLLPHLSMLEILVSTATPSHVGAEDERRSSCLRREHLRLLNLSPGRRSCFQCNLSCVESFERFELTWLFHQRLQSFQSKQGQREGMRANKFWFQMTAINLKLTYMLLQLNSNTLSGKKIFEIVFFSGTAQAVPELTL